MKPTSITLGKTYNTGNYTSKRIDITAEMDEGESVQDVLNRLELELDMKMGIIDIDHLRDVVSDPEEYTGKQVKSAIEVLTLLGEI